MPAFNLLDYPFDWIPLRGKVPIGKDWPNTDYSFFDFVGWRGNIGFRLRPCDTWSYAPGDDPLRRLIDDIGVDLTAAPATITGGGLHLFFGKPEALIQWPALV